MQSENLKMDGAGAPHTIQNRNLTARWLLPVVDSRLYKSLLERFCHARRCHGLDKTMKLCLFQELKLKVFPEALPKFDVTLARQIDPNDGLSFQNRAYRPITWIRSEGKWVSYEFRDEQQNLTNLDISKEFFGRCKGLMDEVGEIVDGYPFRDCVVLTLMPSIT